MATISSLPEPSADWERVLDALRCGDRRRLEQVVQRYRPYLYRIAKEDFPAELRGRLSPSDVVQDAMLRIQTGLPQFRGTTEPQFRMWLRRIVKNDLENTRRYHLSQKRQIGRDLQPKFLESLRTDTTPSHALMRQEAVQSLARYVQHLEPAYQDIIYLRYAQGLSFDEIAQKLRRSPGAIKSTWFRALDLLRRSFGDYPAASSDSGY